nr:unnamed protein product [Callosobruchus analis]
MLCSITSKIYLYPACDYVILHAQVESRLKYRILFWGSSCHQERVFRLQKRCLKNIFNIPSQTSCKSVFKENRLLTLPCMFMLEVLMYIKNNIENLSVNADVHQYQTRFNDSLVIPKHSSTLYEKSPNYLEIKVYNTLDVSIRNVHDSVKFKKLVFNLLATNAYYSVTEFLYPKL